VSRLHEVIRIVRAQVGIDEIGSALERGHAARQGNSASGLEGLGECIEYTVEAAAQPPTPADREQQAIEDAPARDRAVQRHACAARTGLDTPEHAGTRPAAHGGPAAEAVRLVLGGDGRSRGAP
jgi:hypothetical protein